MRAQTGLADTPAGNAPRRILPSTIYRFVLSTSGLHQVLLVTLSVVVFLIEVVPLELQRRIVNDLVKNRPYRSVVALCLLYAAIALGHGGTKLVLNIYRGWVGERVTRALRLRIAALLARYGPLVPTVETDGVGISLVISEVEPIGGFVGGSISEPILQAGVLASVIAYIIHVEPLMAAAALALFVPQLVFVPLLQSAINRRSAARVWMLRRLSIGLVEHRDHAREHAGKGGSLIDRVFQLDMGIFRFKFSMNFLMNFCNHLQIVSALLLGGWFVLTDQLEIGGVIAVISGIHRLNDPWGDLVNYFRDVSGTEVKLRLLESAID